MNSNYLYPGSGLEDDGRESAELKVGLYGCIAALAGASFIQNSEGKP